MDEQPRAEVVREWSALAATTGQSGVGRLSGAVAAARGLSSAFILALLVGGVFAAPAMALFALASLFMPFVAIRAMAPTLIGLSLVWLTMAILGAHMQPERTRRRGESNASRH